MLSGILCLDKPGGMTSHDVVSWVRRLLGIQAVGHTGTLDPDATGVMLVCLGRATKFARFFENLDKTYWTVLRLGIRTDTQDATGTILSQSVVPPYTPEDIEKVLACFRGHIQQTPPMYSAVKHQGKRLYALARLGQTVVRQARDIFIQRLACLDVRHTQVTLSITCSKGTYIRTLGEDIGLALGCGAHVLHLQRCRVGPYMLKDAWPLEDIASVVKAAELQRALLPLHEAVSFLPSLRLSSEQQELVWTKPGALLPALAAMLEPLPLEISHYRLCDQSQRTVAVIQRHKLLCSGWKLYVTP